MAARCIVAKDAVVPVAFAAALNIFDIPIGGPLGDIEKVGGALAPPFDCCHICAKSDICVEFFSAIRNLG